MHLIIDIRSPSPIDPIMTRYAMSWVDLWLARHPTDRVSYLHFGYQICPDNGRSLVIPSSSWWKNKKSLSIPATNEIFRCVNFSPYSPYDKNIGNISHIWDHADILYPHTETTLVGKLSKIYKKKRNTVSEVIVVPSLSIGQETVEINHIREENIEIIPYITLTPGKGDRHTLSQLSISGSYWIYDGSYGSESGIPNLLKGYKKYRELGGTHQLLLLGQDISHELRNISNLIYQLELTGSVRIIGTIETHAIESLYQNASGWIYIGAYYTGGPRIELARSHHIPLLLSDIASLADYPEAIRVHPNHLGTLGELLKQLEQSEQKETRKISNDDIMKKYEKLLAEKR